MHVVISTATTKIIIIVRVYKTPTDVIIENNKPKIRQERKKGNIEYVQTESI